MKSDDSSLQAWRELCERGFGTIHIGWKVFEVCDPMKTRLQIDRADPRILVSHEMLGKIKSGNDQLLLNPFESPWVTLDGDALRIEAWNRTVIYRVGAYWPDIDCYEAEWPD